MAEVKVSEIPGLVEVQLDVRRDERGSFTETFDRRVLRSAEIDFTPVQANRSINTGMVTRGIHAEPWNKYIYIPAGGVRAVIVDLRSGDNFGKVGEFDIDQSNALYIPAGCGNSYQTTEPGTVYSYLVDAHYDMSLAGMYPAVNLEDLELGIDWPVDIRETAVSEKDLHAGTLRDFARVAFEGVKE